MNVVSPNFRLSDITCWVVHKGCLVLGTNDGHVIPIGKPGGSIVSTIIIGGGGRAAIQKLSEKYHSMTAEQQAAAVALETQFVADVEALCAESDSDESDEQ